MVFATCSYVRSSTVTVPIEWMIAVVVGGCRPRSVATSPGEEFCANRETDDQSGVVVVVFTPPGGEFGDATKPFICAPWRNRARRRVQLEHQLVGSIGLGSRIDSSVGERRRLRRRVGRRGSVCDGT